MWPLSHSEIHATGFHARMKNWLGFLATLAASFSVIGQDFHQIPMHSKGSQTYYIDSAFPGAGEVSMLVDTGSGYSVINEETLNHLKSLGNAEYISQLKGKMADGSERIFPLYRISEITLGNSCVIQNIKAAVLPGNARQIIGLSTLMQAAPFAMAFDPPALTLSQCDRKQFSSAKKESLDDLHTDTVENNQASPTKGNET